MKNIVIILCLLASFTLKAQEKQSSGLNAKEFHKYWKVESEAADYKVTFLGDTAEIVSPKGLTLWRKEKMSGRVTIEYDACVVDESGSDRLSDLNCFWMASDPKFPNDLWKREKWRNGIFTNCYSLQLYYMGYGGNHNTTTRFRRYNGDEAAIADPKLRPAILKEYTDADHLLKANHWYHIRITNENNRVSYYIDEKRLVDFRDAEPLKEGWFGFRTTLSRTRITNFKYECTPLAESAVPLRWVGETPAQDKAVSFGVPFDKGQIFPENGLQLSTNEGEIVPIDTWPLAYWPDGSLKWIGAAGVIPAGTESLKLKELDKHKKTWRKNANAGSEGAVSLLETSQGIQIETGVISAYISRQGQFLLDSLFYKGTKVGEKSRLVCNTQSAPILESTTQISFAHYTGWIQSAVVERIGKVRALVKLTGVHRSDTGREWLPFVVRLYFYAGSEQVKMVHSFVYDGDQHQDFIRALGVRFDVPMREALYNRHIAFSAADGGVWSEPVQPLVGRRVLALGQPENEEHQRNSSEESLQQKQMAGQRIPSYESFDKKNQELIDHWASWNDYRLTHLTADAFSIRKRANHDNPWIGTFSGKRSAGYAFVGDVSGGLGVCLHDFWQSYPSALEIENARTNSASLTVWLWSPEAEPMDLRHYDNIAHDLDASYEDVQEGLSTPYGIARTSTLTLWPQAAYPGKAAIAAQAANASAVAQLICEPEYLHAKRAFGVWSLPDRTTPLRSQIEDRLDGMIDFYRDAIEQHKWYGFWNYGDVMHAYDPVRHEWKYDVGGFAWDNTELASNMWLWYSFLRTGRADIWRMAEAMTRHTGEVDVYHLGPNAPLGSRHNVSHWGCGAKEARISQAAWNRFYYYLTTDERCGDLMEEVKDAEQKLYTLDPMRLAEPREQFPCTAPTRLRIGPDWLAYAGNWMTEWERTRNTNYRDKIIAGMRSIASLPNGLFTGNKALGFDPATGRLSYEGDPTLQNTNHLMPIMGGFEVMNELLEMIDLPEWETAWLDHALRYKQQARDISRSNFRISRLEGYAAWRLNRPDLGKEAWNDLLYPRKQVREFAPFVVNKVLPPDVPAAINESPGVSTNGVATWGLDAIYLLEVCPPDE